MVLRVPVLYGPVEYLGESAVTTLLQTITERDKPANYELRRMAHICNSSFHGYKRGCCNCRLRIYASIRSRVG